MTALVATGSGVIPVTSTGSTLKEAKEALAERLRAEGAWNEKSTT